MITTAKVVKSDTNPELVGTTLTVDVTTPSMQNQKNIYGDIKNPVLILRVDYSYNLRSGQFQIGNMIYLISNTVPLQDATSWYVTEYREVG